MKTTGTLLLIGGTSGIGRAVALHYAKAGWRVRLAARNLEEVECNANDIAVRYEAEVTTHVLDILRTDTFEAFVNRLPELPDTVMCVIGWMGSQPQAEVDLDHAGQVLRSNFEGPALLLSLFAERFAARRAGVIVGFSSVAGDRGRASNYYYGAAKAGFTAFLSGLRNRLSTTGVRVVTIKPGFVRTKMTAGMVLPACLTADPAHVARVVFAAAEDRRADVVYVPGLWRPVMFVIKCLPEMIFKRLHL
ncbi:MAG TPA: SDR family oxidoreductase [Devosiaceae bacterium]|nr:SDR family oxidoreductase [Devosiaceae bacterium]